MQVGLLIFLSLATYRVTRFVVEDTLIQHQRIWVLNRIMGRKPRAWREKLYELLSCKFCLSIWFAAGAVAITDAFTSVPLPVLMWLAVSAGALVIWRAAEGD